MKTMLLAFAAAILISIIAFYGLHAIGFSAADSTVSDNVRLSE